MQMSTAKQRQLRQTYKQNWGLEWPFNNHFLTELWVEAKELNGQGAKSKQFSREATEDCLVLMRENHEFDPRH